MDLDRPSPTSAPPGRSARRIALAELIDPGTRLERRWSTVPASRAWQVMPVTQRRRVPVLESLIGRARPIQTKARYAAELRNNRHAHGARILRPP